MSSYKKVVVLPYHEYEQLIKSSGQKNLNKPIHDIDQLVSRSLTDSLLKDSIEGVIKSRGGQYINSPEDLEEEESESEEIVPEKESVPYVDWSSNWEAI